MVKQENLSNSPTKGQDLKYVRYQFSNDDVNISFYPAWYQGNFHWSLANRELTVGFETYNLEVLTDSTLAFAKDGFRRFSFISEEKYAALNQTPDTALSINGAKVYIADNHLTPRLKKQFNITEIIKMSDYNIRKEMIFLAKFVVTDKGKVDRVEIVKSINSGFDDQFKSLLQQTNGKWLPAILNNKPVNSQLTYTIHYLDSITDY